MCVPKAHGDHQARPVHLLPRVSPRAPTPCKRQKMQARRRQPTNMTNPTIRCRTKTRRVSAASVKRCSPSRPLCTSRPTCQPGSFGSSARFCGAASRPPHRSSPGIQHAPQLLDARRADGRDGRGAHVPIGRRALAAVLVRHVKIQLLINHVRYASSSGTAACILTTVCVFTLSILTWSPNKLIPGSCNTLSLSLCRPHDPRDRTGPTQCDGEPYLPSWFVPNLNLGRAATYKRCFTSGKAWLDRFLAWPLPLCPCMPCGTCFQLFYVLVCVQKLPVL